MYTPIKILFHCLNKLIWWRHKVNWSTNKAFDPLLFIYLAEFSNLEREQHWTGLIHLLRQCWISSKFLSHSKRNCMVTWPQIACNNTVWSITFWWCLKGFQLLLFSSDSEEFWGKTPSFTKKHGRRWPAGICSPLLIRRYVCYGWVCFFIYYQNSLPDCKYCTC